MAYKIKKFFNKQIVGLVLAVSIVFSASYAPVFTPRAQAILGIGDFGFDLEDVVKFALDAVAVPMAQQMVDDIVKETINWANTGFEGGPAYVTDPEQYFINSADAVAGEFIEGSDLGFLCSPFQANIRLSLARQYYQPAQERFQCTLSEVSGNIEGFFNGDFNAGGGWDAWFAATQNPTNNPYGAYLEAKVELDGRIAERVGLDKSEFLVNQGFLSFKECAAFNPEQDVIDAYESGDYRTEVGSTASQNEAYLRARSIEQGNTPYDPTKPAGACIKDGPVKTAGSTIKSQLDRVLPSGMERLVNADQMSELVGAFASGLLQRYVFGDKGLFASNTGESTRSGRELIDIDNPTDGIPDGYDTDGNGQLDICHHGLRPGLDIGSRPNNENCLRSSEVQNSPYFASMCERIGRTTGELEKYLDFLERNNFREEYANTWLNRSTVVSGSVEELETTIGRLGVMEFDPALFALGEYTRRLDSIITSLAKDGDIKGGFLTGDSTSDNENRITNGTRDMLSYLRNFRQAMGRCDAPNTDAISNVPTPEFEPIPEPPRENPAATTTPQ